MNNFLNLLMTQFGGPIVAMVADRLGVSSTQAKIALSLFLPIIVKALSSNTAKEEGSTSLHKAVVKDHDGSIFEKLSELFGMGTAASTEAPKEDVIAVETEIKKDGKGINGHVFGGQAGLIADFIAKATGMSPEAAANLMNMAAPIVMGVLGKEQRKENLDKEGLSDLLKTTQQDVQKTDPVNTGLIGTILDSDGDGQVIDDIAAMGWSFLKNWMNGRPATIQ